jgi:hypothetical protein
LSSINGISADKAAAFAAIYSSGCRLITSNGSSVYGTDTITFEGADQSLVNDVTILYSDSTCTTPSLLTVSNGTFAFSEGNKKITLTATSISMMPDGQAIADSLNAANVCGINTWQNGIQVNIMQTSCKDEMAAAVFYINSNDAEANSIQLYQCTDDSLTSCSSETYTRDRN